MDTQHCIHPNHLRPSVPQSLHYLVAIGIEMNKMEGGDADWDKTLEHLIINSL